MVTDFSGKDKASGVTFCTVVHRRPRQGISHFGELCSPEAQYQKNQPVRDHLHDVHNDYPLAAKHILVSIFTSSINSKSFPPCIR